MLRFLLLSLLALQISFAGTVENIGNLLLGIQTVATPGYEYWKNDNDGLLQYGKTQVLNAAVTLSLKASIKKERPDGSGNDSFPSGHTSIAFANATHAALRYGVNPYTVSSFIMAAGIGYTRVASDRHYTEDVVAGAAIGALSSYVFTTRYHMENISFSCDHHGAKVSFLYKF